MSLNKTFAILSACTLAVIFSLVVIASAVSPSVAEQNQEQQKV